MTAWPGCIRGSTGRCSTRYRSRGAPTRRTRWPGSARCQWTARTATTRRGMDPRGSQYLSERGRRDAMTQLEQLARDPPMTPQSILPSHPQDQSLDHRPGARPARRPAYRSVLARHQPAADTGCRSTPGKPTSRRDHAQSNWSDRNRVFEWHRPLAAVRRAGAGPLCESTSGTVWKSVRAKALRGKATTTLAR
jgi:hypothetical protein